MDRLKGLLKRGAILGLAVIAVFWINNRILEDHITIPDIETDQPQSALPQERRVLSEVASFTPEQFRAAYDNISLPNITPIVLTPEITGNLSADNKIREIAETRGYKLRHVASGVLNEIDTRPVQELLINDWENLQEAATDDGVNVNFVSGYRSVEDQRELFLNRLSAAGISISGVASGSQADLVTSVLRTTAPPGYSRHHSGYTIDLKDPGFAVFANSTAYVWLSANNFTNAKTYGFIPSYPIGLTNQGPEPEAWEFVWVGKEITYK